MIYNRLSTTVSVDNEFKLASYLTDSTSSHLAGVMLASSTHWDVLPDEQLHMVVCHKGL